MSEPLELDGCTPDPLMAYLKALGVLRLVSEQTDPDARGCWREGVFALETKLNRDGLVKFFQKEYKPSPIIVPWSGSDFFGVNIEKAQGPYAETPTGSRIVEAFGSVSGERLQGYREVIGASVGTMGSLGLIKKEQLEKAAGAKMKVRFLSRLRSRLPDSLVEWIDVAAQLTSDEFVPNVLLGSGGGNDGNTHFSDNFMQNLWDVLPDFDQQRGISGTFSGKGWTTKKPPEPVPGRLSVSKLKKGGFTVVTTLPADEVLKRLVEANPNEQLLPRDIERRFLHRTATHALGCEVIESALFGTPVRGLLAGRTSALFNSGGVGGPNAGVGLERDALLNPWDFILAIEGAICLAGAVSKRQGVHARRAPAFPFSVRMTASGFGSGIDQENGQSEIWLPLWNRSLRYSELRMLLSNGRCEVGRRPARTGLDFARAVASVGVDAGIPAFSRFGIVKGRVGGENYYTAVSVGLFDVKVRSNVGLFGELDRWLELLEMATAKDDTPSRFKTARRRIEEAIFDLCRYAQGCDDASWAQAVLAALGAAERELSIGTFAQKLVRGANRPRINPLGELSADWLTAADDGSKEFRLARSVALLNLGINGTGPIRRYLEPVQLKRRSWVWGERGGHVVWGGGDVTRNLGAILSRRLMDARQNGEPTLPLGSPFPVPLDDISAFLYGDIDEAKLEDLLWGLSLIARGHGKPIPKSETKAELPRPYALMKLTLLPGRLEWAKSPNGDLTLRLNSPKAEGAMSGVAIKPEPAITAMLRAGDVSGGCVVAARRLRSSGFTPLCGFLPDSSRPGFDWSATRVSPERLLAALLFPIPNHAVNQLADLVLRRPSLESLV